MMVTMTTMVARRSIPPSDPTTAPTITGIVLTSSVSLGVGCWTKQMEILKRIITHLFYVHIS